MAATKVTKLEVLDEVFTMKSARTKGFSLDDLVNRVEKETGNATERGVKMLVGRVRKNLEGQGLTIVQKDNGKYVVREL